MGKNIAKTLTNVLWHQCSVTKRFSHLFLSVSVSLSLSFLPVCVSFFLSPSFSLSLNLFVSYYYFFLSLSLSVLAYFFLFLLLSFSVIITLYLCMFCSYFLLFNQINKQLTFLSFFPFPSHFQIPQKNFVCLFTVYFKFLSSCLSVNLYIYLSSCLSFFCLSCYLLISFNSWLNGFVVSKTGKLNLLYCFAHKKDDLQAKLWYVS